MKDRVKEFARNGKMTELEQLNLPDELMEHIQQVADEVKRIGSLSI